jgi:hypothetical protein
VRARAWVRRVHACVGVCVCAQKHELVIVTTFSCIYLQQSVNTECTVIILLLALVTVVDILCIAQKVNFNQIYSKLFTIRKYATLQDCYDIYLHKGRRLFLLYKNKIGRRGCTDAS